MNSFTRLSRRSEELGLIKKRIRQEVDRRQKEPELKQNPCDPSVSSSASTPVDHPLAALFKLIQSDSNPFKPKSK